MSHTKNKHLQELFESSVMGNILVPIESGVFLDGYNRRWHRNISGTISTRISAGCDWRVIVEDGNKEDKTE